MKFFSSLILLFFLSITLIFSQEKSAKWEIKDVVNQESVSQPAFSPDGNLMAWVKRRPAPKKDKFVSDLYLTKFYPDTDKKPKQIQLTRSDASDSSPFFSKDGETLYFLSSRKKGNKLWAFNLLGGEPYAVDSFPNGISSIKWLDDSTITYLANEGKTLYEEELKKKKDNVVVVEDEDHVKPRRVFSYNFKTKKKKRITDNEHPVSSYAVSKDGKWLTSSHTRSPHYPVDGKPKPVYYLWNLTDGTKTQILKEYQTPGSFSFLKNNEGFYFSAVQSSNPEWEGAGISLLYYFELASQEITQVPLKHEWAMSGGFDVLGNDAIVSLANGTTRLLAYYSKNKNKWRKSMIDIGSMNEHISIMKISENEKKIAFNYSTASTPNQYRVSPINYTRVGINLEEGEEFATVNKHLKNKNFAKTESRKWIGALNEEVTGILYYPTNYEEGKKYPLMIAIHGGPSGADTDRWSDRWAYYHNLLAQRGMFILKPNYHGSSNHGQKFVESIKGHYYEYEIPDVLTGIDMLDKEGKINKDSMAVMGWSNGAIIATMLTVQYPDMFLAAGAGAGDVNWTSDYGTCRFGVTFDQSYFGGAPWDDRNGKSYNENYILKSPLFEMEKVKTPTIIFHGSEDRAVPRDQGWEYYRALQQIDKAPVRFLWFPGQPHGLQKITHQTRKIKEELAWFDHFFLGKYEPDNEAVKKESPLMALLELEKAEKNNGAYGILFNKTIIPEVMAVKDDSISIGCFEITHAQYQNFKKDHVFPMSHTNYPVTGISFNDAQDYAKWLSETTGKKYRLPNAEEANALHKKARTVAAKENTLNYWAGYKITIDEVEDFQKKIETVSGTLIQEAGKHKALKIGKAKVFDLGGNASEYFNDNGKEGIYGYSAYDFYDSTDEKAGGKGKNVGFRVILESK